jgi:hypothetical protein
LPNTIENREKQQAAAAKINTGRALSTYAAKFVQCGFSASPE